MESDYIVFILNQHEIRELILNYVGVKERISLMLTCHNIHHSTKFSHFEQQSARRKFFDTIQRLSQEYSSYLSVEDRLRNILTRNLIFLQLLQLNTPNPKIITTKY